MKTKTLVLFALLVITGNVFAQQNVVVKKYLNIDNALVFNSTGINLHKYDWSDSNINLHIYTVTTQLKKAQNKTIAGKVFLGLGIGAISTAITLDYPIVGLASIPCFAISTGLFVGSINHKKRSKKSFNAVSDYYRTHNLF